MFPTLQRLALYQGTTSSRAVKAQTELGLKPVHLWTNIECGNNPLFRNVRDVIGLQEAWRVTMFSNQLNQVLRRLSRVPLFTSITLLTLAIGVGATRCAALDELSAEVVLHDGLGWAYIWFPLTFLTFLGALRIGFNYRDRSWQSIGMRLSLIHI